MDNMGERIILEPNVEKNLFDKEKQIVRKYLKNSGHRYADYVLEKIENPEVIILNKAYKIEIYDKHSELLATINDIELCQKIFQYYKEITGKDFTEIYDRDFDLKECFKTYMEYVIKDIVDGEEHIITKIIKEILICPDDEEYPEVEPQNPPPTGDDPEHQIVLPPRDV
ncbi:MAG: hypothetical protein ACOCWO_03605 [Candidatus Muiribacteriaceae bacterium]